MNELTRTLSRKKSKEEPQQGIERKDGVEETQSDNHSGSRITERLGVVLSEYDG